MSDLKVILEILALGAVFLENSFWTVATVVAVWRGKYQLAAWFYVFQLLTGIAFRLRIHLP